MKQYKALIPLMLPSGVVRITDEQAKPRLRNLRNIGGGSFEIIKPICFKAGEVFGFNGQLSKLSAEAIESAEPEKKPKGKKD